MNKPKSEINAAEPMQKKASLEGKLDQGVFVKKKKSTKIPR
jgi:hypothetical protein